MLEIISDPAQPTAIPDKTEKPHVVILLDESGSMGDWRAAVVDTFNEYVNSVRDTAETVSLYTFDSTGIREKIFRVEPEKVQPLTIKDYQPTAMTPLYDAMAMVMIKHEDAGKVQFVVHTDGQENSSKEYSFNNLDAMIKEKTKQGWMFVYLGEGVQGQKEMKKFGGLKMNFSSINRGRAMDQVSLATSAYCATGLNRAEAYAAVGELNIDNNDKIAPAS